MDLGLSPCSKLGPGRIRVSPSPPPPDLSPVVFSAAAAPTRIPRRLGSHATTVLTSSALRADTRDATPNPGSAPPRPETPPPSGWLGPCT